MKAGAVGTFLSNALGGSISKAIGADEFGDLPASTRAGLKERGQRFQLRIWASGAGVCALLQVGVVRSVRLIRSIRLSEHQQDFVKHLESLEVAPQIEACAAQARLAIRVLQLPNFLVHNDAILRFPEQPWVSDHEENAKCVEREQQNERLPRFPDARRNVTLHLVTSTRARRADCLGVLTDKQARRG
eukprot:7391958-Prymnesium_polylepis.2